MCVQTYRKKNIISHKEQPKYRISDIRCILLVQFVLSVANNRRFCIDNLSRLGKDKSWRISNDTANQEFFHVPKQVFKHRSLNSCEKQDKAKSFYVRNERRIIIPLLLANIATKVNLRYTHYVQFDMIQETYLITKISEQGQKTEVRQCIGYNQAFRLNRVCFFDFFHE